MESHYHSTKENNLGTAISKERYGESLLWP